MDQNDEPPERWIDDSQPTAPLTRTAASKILGVSVATVRRWEGTKLHPTVDQFGRHVFERAEVTELAQTKARTVAKRRTDGKLAAKVFTMFEDGEELPAIVIALEIEPRIVRELYEEWYVDLDTRLKQQRRQARAREQAREAATIRREVRDWERLVREDATRDVENRAPRFATDAARPVARTSPVHRSAGKKGR